MLRKFQSIITDRATRIPDGELVPGASARSRYRNLKGIEKRRLKKSLIEYKRFDA